MLRITFFGLTLSSSWGNGHATSYRAILRGLQRRKVRLSFFEKDVPYYAKHRDFATCEYCDLVLYRDWHQVRGQALGRARDSDIVVAASYCPEGAHIAQELLTLQHSLCVFYDLDTPVTLFGLEAGGVDYLRREQIPEFDLYLSFGGGNILSVLEHKFGARRARALYGCVDPQIHRRLPVCKQYQCSLSYMGTYAPDREHKFRNLFLEPAQRRQEWQFLLAGSMYPQGCWIPGNVRHREHVAPEEHASLYSSSRATLNLTRGEMTRWGYCPSGRLFEAAACGTPILTDWWGGLDHFFDVKQELQVVHNADDVLQALDQPEGELLEMARRARDRTLEEHTGDRRAEQLLAYCEEAANSKAAAQEVTS
jgi:spore maturation protein CgeB